MPEPESYSYPQYLQAKRSVDARALNCRVWTRFLDSLPQSSAPLRVLEVGGGTGATFLRVLNALEDRGLGRNIQYVLVDHTPENIAAASEQVRMWAADRNYYVKGAKNEIELNVGSEEVHLSLVTDDLFTFADLQSTSSFDVVIAQAVLDLLDLTSFFQSLRSLLREGGVWYLPIHFDGMTVFEPSVDQKLDEKIERLYHESMGEIDEEGGLRAHTGRRLLTVLPEHGNQVLEAGSSAWIVLPRDDEYPEEEEYFLHHILHFVESELTGHPQLDEHVFSKWIRARRQQIQHGRLVYIAHHLDVLAQKI